MIFASSPEPIDGVAHVWLENGTGLLAELPPAEARDLAADLLAAALFAENGWNCFERVGRGSERLHPCSQRQEKADMRDLIAEERFQAAQQSRAKAIDQLANAVLSLPILPTDGVCCEDQDLRVITADLEPSCQLEYDQAGWIASTDGWDDMGDVTGPQYAARSRTLPGTADQRSSMTDRVGGQDLR